jgi:hypothetical protein
MTEKGHKCHNSVCHSHILLFCQTEMGGTVSLSFPGAKMASSASEYAVYINKEMNGVLFNIHLIQGMCVSANRIIETKMF